MPGLKPDLLCLRDEENRLPRSLSSVCEPRRYPVGVAVMVGEGVLWVDDAGSVLEV